jgi:hypothetical protein
MVAYSAAMCLAFGAVALFGYNEPPAQLVWMFGSGMHFGMGVMWVITTPSRLNEKWRKRMQAEIDVMMAQAVARNMWSPPTAPHEQRRTLQ